VTIFLIDADNLNSGAWIDEAFRVLQESEGPLPVRRAYGSSDNLKNLADVLRAWAVRPFVNLALTKNTTDIALAVDAMELACQSPPPQLVVIGSGDADFLPLVVRLRERGIRMVCVSERSKMGREAVSAYDRVILVGPAQEPLPCPESASEKPARKTAKVPAKKVAAKTAAPKPAAAKKAPAKKAKSSAPVVVTAGSVAPVQALPDVAAILQAVPSLQDGQPHPLAAVAKALLDAKLRGKNTTATKLLKKFPLHFSLLPLEKPRTVTYHLPQEPV
jgi:uncharacterized LabA/DUF88 family protein